MKRRSFLRGCAAFGVALAGRPAFARSYMRSGLVPVTAIDASNQVGYQLVITPAAHPFNQGDIITIDGVRSVQPWTGIPMDKLRQFVITKTTESGGRVLHIYPPISLGEDGRRTVTETARHLAFVKVVNPAS